MKLQRILQARGGSRVLPLVFTGLSAVLLWQARQLPAEGQFGPGAGLFPGYVASICLVLSLLLLVFPGLVRTKGGASEDDEPVAPQQRRPLAWYLVAVLLMASASLTGFLLAALGISVAISWGAEGRPLRSALVFGLVCGLVVVIGLGGLLNVDVPAAALDHVLMRLVR